MYIFKKSSGYIGWYEEKQQEDIAAKGASYRKMQAIKAEIEVMKLKWRWLDLELRYSDDQPRDDHGRWTSGGGSGAGLTSGGDGGTIEGEEILPSIGGSASSYPIVYYPGTDVQVRFVVGSRPQYPPDHTMAGYGCKTGRQIDDIDRLVDTYNADAVHWHKEKARFQVYDEYGEIREVELHWYQHPDIGKVEYKVKSRGGYVYVDEWD